MREEGEVLRVKLGGPATLKTIGVVALKDPEVPVTVME